MQVIGRIYLYKGHAFFKEENKGKTTYYGTPLEPSIFWQPCKQQDYQQAKYHGMPARNNLLPKKIREREKKQNYRRASV